MNLHCRLCNVQNNSEAAQLILQQLADSAFPIGGQSHSFGLETLVSDGQLTPHTLEQFLKDFLAESAIVDAWLCRQGYQLAAIGDDSLFRSEWLQLNRQSSALRTARESRAASAALGRRFLALVQSLSEKPRLRAAYQASRANGEELHHALAYGLAGGELQLGEEQTVLALLQQSINALLIASQKLMAIGQSQTVGILWHIKSDIVATAEASKSFSREKGFSSFGFMLEIASMRHVTLPVRLFIS